MLSVARQTSEPMQGLLLLASFLEAKSNTWSYFELHKRGLCESGGAAVRTQASSVLVGLFAKRTGLGGTHLPPSFR